MKSKYELLKYFKIWKAQARTFLGGKIKILQNDSGVEYFSNHFCKENGIIKQMTTLYILDQNGVVKHKNKTLVESARCMISFVRFTNSFWAKVVFTTNYIQNKVSTSALVGIINLEE